MGKEKWAARTAVGLLGRAAFREASCSHTRLCPTLQREITLPTCTRSGGAWMRPPGVLLVFSLPRLCESSTHTLFHLQVKARVSSTTADEKHNAPVGAASKSLARALASPGVDENPMPVQARFSMYAARVPGSRGVGRRLVASPSVIDAPGAAHDATSATPTAHRRRPAVAGASGSDPRAAASPAVNPRSTPPAFSPVPFSLVGAECDNSPLVPPPGSGAGRRALGAPVRTRVTGAPLPRSAGSERSPMGIMVPLTPAAGGPIDARAGATVATSRAAPPPAALAPAEHVARKLSMASSVSDEDASTESDDSVSWAAFKRRAAVAAPPPATVARRASSSSSMASDDTDVLLSGIDSFSAARAKGRRVAVAEQAAPAAFVPRGTGPTSAPQPTARPEVVPPCTPRLPITVAAEPSAREPEDAGLGAGAMRISLSLDAAEAADVRAASSRVRAALVDYGSTYSHRHEGEGGEAPTIYAYVPAEAALARSRRTLEEARAARELRTAGTYASTRQAPATRPAVTDAAERPSPAPALKPSGLAWFTPGGVAPGSSPGAPRNLCATFALAGGRPVATELAGRTESAEEPTPMPRRR
jgi:hypothetical protein